MKLIPVAIGLMDLSRRNGASGVHGTPPVLYAQVQAWGYVLLALPSCAPALVALHSGPGVGVLRWSCLPFSALK